MPAPTTSATEFLILLGYLALFAAAILGYGFSAINIVFPDQPAQSIVKLLVKLVTMVVLPMALFARAAPVNSTSPASNRRNVLALVVLGIAYLAFQYFVGRGVQNLSALHPTTATLLWRIPACLLWLIVKAGLCEEVLFVACCRNASPARPVRRSSRSCGRRYCSALRTRRVCTCADRACWKVSPRRHRSGRSLTRSR